MADKPEKVEEIKVGMTCRKIHFLHACHRGVKDDAIIGYYTINYEDKSQETIARVYGKEIADWWYTEGNGGYMLVLPSPIATRSSQLFNVRMDMAAGSKRRRRS